MITTEYHDKTVGEIAAAMPTSIPVFEAWKIDYCCGGRTPLPDACADAGKTVEQFVLAVAETATLPDGGAPDWSHETLGTIATNIVDVYHRFTREELQVLTPLAEKVFHVHGHRRGELAQVLSLVNDVSADMLPHMLKEEQVLFPYVTQLEHAAFAGGEVPAPFFGTVKNPVRMMMMEHDRVGGLLARLRVVTSGFIAPDDACFSYRELYRRLAEFELRTHEHIHIENNLYFPRAVELEDDRKSAPRY
jgi:regulator of cell morphogenesis and NO signaling